MKKPSQLAERRYFPRWTVEHKVIYKKIAAGNGFAAASNHHPEEKSPSLKIKKETPPVYHEGFSRDIGCEGTSLYTDESLAPSQKLKLLVYLSEDVAVQVDGTVLWQQPAEKQNLLGVRFENVTSQVQNLILQHAFECKKEDLQRNWFAGW